MKCPECGKDLQPDFNYCPGCGIEIDSKAEFRQVIDESFSRLEDVVLGDTILRLDNLYSRLDNIEEDLDVFLSGVKQGS